MKKEAYYKKLEVPEDTYRITCFIRISSDYTIAHIVEHLWWAKTWVVDESYAPTSIIRCRVKPPHWKEFTADVKKNLKAEFLRFSYRDGKYPVFTVQTDKNTFTLFDRGW